MKQLKKYETVIGNVSTNYLLSQVTDQKEALRELEGQIGFELKGYAPGTVAVPDRLKIPVDRLHDYFKSALNIHSNGG